jgi:hypothetical protein
MRKHLTQKETIFYQLYQARKKDPDEYIAIWKLIGEVYCEELNKHGFMSYEVSARMSEMYQDNPGLLERKWLKGITGAKYYGYRIAHGANASNIHDEKLLAFYQKFRRAS